MAVREKGLGIGSTVSLQGGEFIPREYHRRILKKIAQLTKVIYSLNTKIDENDSFVASLRAIHETENRRVLEDSSTQLKRCEEVFERKQESTQRQLEKLSQALENIRGERDQLFDKQVSYRKEVEGQLSTLKSEHTTKVQSLITQLEKFRSEQTKQLKQIGDLRTKMLKQASEEMKVLRLQHEEELAKVRQDGQLLTQTLNNEISSLKSQHAAEIDSLTKKFQSQLDAQSKSLTSAQKDLISHERQAYEEKERHLNATCIEKEELLKQQISNLSKELRTSNDKLALAEQRIRDMEAHFEESRAGSGTLKALLEKSEADIECLRGTVNSLQTDLDIAREKYNQQTVELQTTSGTIAKLEAARVSNESIIATLRFELASVQDKLKILQEERKGMKNSQLSLNENQTARITILERELGKVRAEKQELHAQFAREIEAAHAQLSHRETELEQQHFTVLRDLRDKHSKVLGDVEEDKRLSLDTLKLHLLSQKDQELQQLHDLHSSKISELKAELANKSSDLEQALEELNSLKDKLRQEEQGLGSATSTIDELRSNLMQCQSTLLASQRECADVKTDNAQLKSTIESLQRQQVETERAHWEELRRTRTDLTAQLEAAWKERVKHETTSLRSELSQRHSEEQRVALRELAGLQDTALKQAQERWEGERRKLFDQIASLECELEHLQRKASASLEEAKTSSDSQVTSLRKELENEILKHKETLARVQKSHLQQIQSLQSQYNLEKSALTSQLRDQHSQECLALQQANQLAVNSLREKMESEKRDLLALTNDDHMEQRRLLEERLREQFSGDMAHVQGEHLAEIERFRQQIGSVVSQSQQQMQTQERITDSLRKEIESRASELSVLREKGNSLTVAIADLRKQLTVREQELQLAKREAKSTLRIREQQLIATYHAELESINAQHRHKAQQLLTDFNKAKTLLTSKIHELERQLSDWEQRYKTRDSKPEDVEAIIELRMIVGQQQQKMKDLVAEKRVYQLELMNREKNYNKLFNANPQVGVLNPLQLKQKKTSVVRPESHKYASAPSLLAPLSPEPPQLNPIPHLLKLSALPSDSGLTSSGSQLSKKTLASQSSLEAKPQKFVMLRDSPLTQKRESKQAKTSRKIINSHSGPLQPVETQSQTTISSQKQTMTVQ